jgi:hypothetical protein
VVVVDEVVVVVVPVVIVVIVVWVVVVVGGGVGGGGGEVVVIVVVVAELVVSFWKLWHTNYDGIKQEHCTYTALCTWVQYIFQWNHLPKLTAVSETYIKHWRKYSGFI